MRKPVVGITMGDPAGIGPEVVVKALTDRQIYDLCNPIVIGDRRLLGRALDVCKIKSTLNSVEEPSRGLYSVGTIDLIDIENVDINSLRAKEVQAMCGRASFEYIRTSADLALHNLLDAVVTSPINKETLKAAGLPYIDHTEMFADLTKTRDLLTMFEVRSLRVFFLTKHLSMRDMVKAITKERILGSIIRCTEALRRLGVTEGAMAVAALNPHSGEHGLFGDEEELSIRPAIEEARQKGYNVEGPVAADSVFHLALQGMYNSVLALYHDQGHIATKTLDFYRTISITHGMSFLRASPDHGTAYDRAWTGKANETSITEAIKAAARYTPYFKTGFQ